MAERAMSTLRASAAPTAAPPLTPTPTLTQRARAIAVLDDFDRGRQRRLAIGATLLAAAIGADLLLQLTLAPPHLRAPARLLYSAFEFVAVLASCMGVNAWSQRRGHGPIGRLVRAVLAAGSTGVVLAAIAVASFPPVASSSHPLLPLSGSLLLGFMRGLVTCGMWALGFIYPLAVETERARVDAELSRLRGHLEPHFLLNTLNLIAGLTGQDPDEARRLLGVLGELLADAVEDGPSAVTVDAELGWLRRYADILEARHPDVLTFRFEASDEARVREIPRLLLQPLVENAAKHGVLARPGGGTVLVQAAIEAATLDLLCVVADDGRGLGTRPPRPGAFGLRSVRRRLALERPGATFDLLSTDAGTRAVVRIPRDPHQRLRP
jgi:hypothetical protein